VREGDGVAGLTRLARHPRSFRIIGISTDDDPGQALAWLKALNANINQYIDTRLQMENTLGASRIPFTVLVDAQGWVREKTYGACRWDSPDSLSLIRRTFPPRQ
jgi:hypothetical protein